MNSCENNHQKIYFEGNCPLCPALREIAEYRKLEQVVSDHINEEKHETINTLYPFNLIPSL